MCADGCYWQSYNPDGYRKDLQPDEGSTDIDGAFKLVEPRFLPNLDEGFRPTVSVNRAIQNELKASCDGTPLVLVLGVT